MQVCARFRSAACSSGPTSDERPFSRKADRIRTVKYSVITFGCRVNQSDSLGFEEQFAAAGAEPAPAESADLVVVNTCSVTASADQGARQTIRRIARLNPDARIVVTGCYATRERDQVRQLPNVEQVICNDDKPQLLSLLRPSSLFTS